MTAEGSWIQTDEAEDVAASIRHALRSAAMVANDPQAWKWVALALHSALQGACVCHLVTSATPVGVVTERNAGEWLTYFEDSRTDPDAKPPRTQLLSLPGLLKAVRKARSSGDRISDAAVPITSTELAWLIRIHQTIRNQFVHFAPQGWSIEVSGLPELGALVARIIGDIAAIGYAFRHKDRAWREALARDLAELSAPSWAEQQPSTA